ncbi:MAG: PIN domain-containing protein [Thermoprotei archaeon]|nr:PIN domain-containing protein [Thermoprotei archaeon]
MEAGWLGCRGGVTLILDSNMAMYIVRGLTTLTSIGEVLDSKFDVIVPVAVLKELESIAGSQSYKGRLALRALEALRRVAGTVETLNTNPDDAIVEAALKLKDCRVVVATSDRELRKRLKTHGIPTLYYRKSKGGVELEWSPL